MKTSDFNRGLRALALGSVASMAVVAYGLPALAQQGESGADTGKLEEVVVTAQRRSENLQTTPVAVTAISASALEKSQVTDIRGLQGMVPTLTVSQSHDGDPTTAYVSIRGQVLEQQLITYDPSVGIYMDGVNIARSTGGLLNLIDVQRVEVLRGPQGTLFGRNTTGGAMNIIAKVPEDKFTGSINGRVGNFGLGEVTGVINVPLLDGQVLTRFVYQHHHQEGFGHSVIFEPKRLGDQTMDFFRGSISITLDGMDNVNLLVAGDYTNSRSGGQLWTLKYANDASLSGLDASFCSANPSAPLCPPGAPTLSSLLPYNTGYNNTAVGPDNSAFRSRGVSATLTVDFSDQLHFKSITAYRHVYRYLFHDEDGSPYNLINEVNPNIFAQHQVSEEAQIYGDAFDNKLKWIAGYFFFNEAGSDIESASALAPVFGTNFVVYQPYARNTSNAGYAQLTYEVVPDVHVTGGLRYTKDKRFFNLVDVVKDYFTHAELGCGFEDFLTNPGPYDAGPGGGKICSITRTANFGYWSYTGGADWQIEKGMFVYGKVAKSSRAGGFNGIVSLSVAAEPFAPESVTSFEVGSKLDLIDDHLRINGDFYYSNYTNIQRQVVGVTAGGRTYGVIQNAAKGHITGVELEVQARPMDALRLNGSLGLTFPAYDRYIDPGTGADLSHQVFTYVSKTTFSFGADYDVPVGSLGTMTLHADYNWRSSAYTGYSDQARISPYGLVNASITMSLEKSPLDFSIWARNLTDKYYYGGIFDEKDALGYVAGIPGEPRTFGLTATAHF